LLSVKFGLQKSFVKELDIQEDIFVVKLGLERNNQTTLDLPTKRGASKIL